MLYVIMAVCLGMVLGSLVSYLLYGVAWLSWKVVTLGGLWVLLLYGMVRMVV